MEGFMRHRPLRFFFVSSLLCLACTATIIADSSLNQVAVKGRQPPKMTARPVPIASPVPSPSPSAAAVPPTSPWDPLFSLIGALWNHWKGNKSQQKDTPNAVKTSIASAEQGLAQIQSLPDLMFDSRDFRETMPKSGSR